MTAVPTFIGINAMNTFHILPQGLAAEGDRIGDKVTIKSIQMNLRVHMQSVGATNILTHQRVKMVVILDKQCNGTAATWTDVYEDPIFSSFRNVTNSGRFTVLKEWDICWNSSGVYWDQDTKVGEQAVAVGGIRCVKWYKRCNFPIRYDGVTGALTTIQSNNVFMLAITDSSEPPVAIGGTVRVRYSDM